MESSNQERNTSVFLLAKEGKSRELEDYIRENPKCINICDSNGDSFLHLASRSGHSKCVSVLLKHGANANVLNKNKESPIFDAARGGFLTVLKMLVLEANADISVININGKRAVDVVNRSQGSGCARLLQQPQDIPSKGRGKEENNNNSNSKSANHRPDRHRKPSNANQSVSTFPMKYLANQNDNHISVTSYNIMADSYAKPSFFPGVKDELRWEFRVKNIVNDIVMLNSDIVCLQEVDKYDDLRSALEPHGYRGMFQKRTGSRRDGCAIFYKKECFNPINSYVLRFNDMVEDSELQKDCIALFIAFDVLNAEEKQIPSMLCVGATHLYYKSDIIKKQQVHDLLGFAENIESQYGELSMIINGDFNATPKSLVYEAMNTAGWTSACVQDEHPKTIDYIWIRSPQMECVGYLEVAKEQPAITTKNSSDHWPCKALLSFIN